MRRSRLLLCVLLAVAAVLTLTSCEWFSTLFGEPPTATLSVDPASGDAPLDVSFDLSRSSAPAGVHRFRLDFGDGSDYATGTDLTAEIAHRYDATGTFTAVLEITDENGLTDHDTAIVTVETATSSEEEDGAPNAVLAADTTVGRAPLIVRFDVSLSSAVEGTLVSFRLDFADGTAAYVGTYFASSIVHLYAEPGIYGATLTVTDSEGRTGTATLEIVATTEADGTEPIARFDWNPADPFIDQVVTFDAVASYDTARAEASPQAIVVYTWDFGDGGEAATTEETVEHTYTWPGRYRVTLTVYDDDGIAGTSTESIDVAGAIAYVTSFFDGSVSQIRLPTNTVANTTKPFEWSAGVAIDPDGASVYVGGVSFVEEMAAMARIRTSDQVVRAQAEDLDILPFDIAVSPTGNVLYAVGSPFDTSDMLLVTSTTTMTVVNTVPVQSYPSTVAFSPLGDVAYVAGSDPDSLIEIDTATHTVTDQIDLTAWGAPWGIAISSDGQWALVTLPDVGELLLIDLEDATPVTALALSDPEPTPLGVALTHDDAFAYVTDYEHGSVHVIETAFGAGDVGAAVDEIFLDDAVYGLAWPWDIAISPDDTAAVVPFGLDFYDIEDWWFGGIPFVPALPVFILDLDSNTVADTVTAGFGPVFVDVWGFEY